MQSEYFIFDGIKSQEMEEMYSVRVESGLVESPFFGGQDIEEEWIGDRLTPYDYGVKLNPIEFKIIISPLDKEWTPQLRSMIGKWLIHREYKSFQSSDDLGKYYYIKCIEAPNFKLASNRGYLELTFRTNSAFAFSPIYISDPPFDLSNNTTTQIIIMENMSNVVEYYRPIIEISLVNGETNVMLKNLSNGGEIFSFTGLKENEIVSIDNLNEDIVSSNPLSNPFSKFNGNWLELSYGINYIEVTGKCKIRTKMQYPILQ